MKDVFDRARAYLAKMPVSISGQRGHDAAFGAACAMVHKFRLSAEEAFALMSEWNACCVPPWRDEDLHHKIHDAQRATLGRHQRPMRITTFSQQAAKPPIAAANRKVRWPSFRTLNSTEIDEVAALRNVPHAAIHLAARAGFLGATSYQGHRCLAVGEASFVQLIRFDGGDLRTRNGGVRKKNLPSATGAFLGRKWLDERSHVLLVEGALGLFEAIAAILLVDPAESWAPLAATSAASRFQHAPNLLGQLRGRRVSIVADHDQAGANAARSWFTDLKSVGCQVRIFSDPETKDLGPLVAEPTKHLSTLRSLFS